MPKINVGLSVHVLFTQAHAGADVCVYFKTRLGLRAIGNVYRGDNDSLPNELFRIVGRINDEPIGLSSTKNVFKGTV